MLLHVFLFTPDEVVGWLSSIFSGIHTMPWHATSVLSGLRISHDANILVIVSIVLAKHCVSVLGVVVGLPHRDLGSPLSLLCSLSSGYCVSSEVG